MGRWSRRLCDKCGDKLRAVQEEAEKETARAEAETRRRKMIDEAGIPLVWKNVSFATSDPKINKLALRQSKTYAEKFDPGESGSLFIFSRGYGNGKTHLAACIANHVLHELNLSARFQKARDLSLEIRHTYSDDSGRDEYSYLQWILSFVILVLDDLGKDAWSEHRENTYWTVFDRRLESGLPVVVTSNYSLYETERDVSLGDKIGFGCVSRLRQMCRDNVIELKGPDLR